MNQENRVKSASQVAKAWAALTVIATIAACTKLDLGGSGTPTPFPSVTTSPTTGPTPNACNTPSTIANTVFIAMGNVIGPVSIAPYGTINGYSVVENGQFPVQAELINQWMTGSGVIQTITTKNLLQFVNVDTAGSVHSAVGFATKAFPPTPYTFPTAAASPSSQQQISSQGLWSTGRVGSPPDASEYCYSQTFTLSAGHYYFGDYDFYNLSNVRDVVIVATPSARNTRDLHRR